MTRAFLAFLFLPTLAIATPYDGIYRPFEGASCDVIGQDGGAIEIKDGIFIGVEVQCRMTRPVNVVDMDATLYTMQCSGEGQAWTERAMVMRHANDTDVIMLWDGYAFVNEACEQPSSQTSE